MAQPDSAYMAGAILARVVAARQDHPYGLVMVPLYPEQAAALQSLLEEEVVRRRAAERADGLPDRS